MSSPAVGANGLVYFGSFDWNVYALDSHSGADRWKYKTGGEIWSSPAIGDDGTVYIGSNDGYVYALNGSTGVPRWSAKTGGQVRSSPAIGSDRAVYVGSSDGGLYALQADTGASKWPQAFVAAGEVGCAPAVGADDTVYFGSLGGYFYAVQGATGNGLWSLQTGNTNRSSPTVGPDGTVYFGSWNGILYAVEGNVAEGLANSSWPKFRGRLENTGSRQPLTSVIHWVTNTVTVQTHAGSGLAGWADGLGLNAQFNAPNGCAVDPAGNVYVADQTNHCIRKITPDGGVTTLAGKPGVAGHQDGIGADARFNEPIGLCLDSQGKLYVAEKSHWIRLVRTDGSATTWAGSGLPGKTDVSTPSLAAQLNLPNDVAMAADGGVYISEFGNHTVLKLTLDGNVIPWVGKAGEPGSANGERLNARLDTPGGIATDADGNLYIAEWGGNRVRRVDHATGMVTTLAGSPTSVAGYVDDLDGSRARFRNPDGIAVDLLGNLYVTEHANYSARRITPAGVVETVAGVNLNGWRDDPEDNSGDPARAKRNARFSDVTGIGTDNQGHLFVTEGGNSRVRKLTLHGPPAILASSLPDQVAVEGESVALSVTATGLGPIGYRWFKDGAQLGGQTGSALTFPAVVATNAATYWVEVSNTYGSVRATNSLTVLIPPKVEQLPEDVSAIEGATTNLSVIVTGTAPLDYQWFNDDGPIDGATGPTLWFTNIQSSASGFYWVQARNVLKGVTYSVKTQSARVTVNAPPTLLSGPAAQTVRLGGDAEFSVQVAGTTPLWYRWYKDDLALTGVGTNVLRLVNVKPTDAGFYWVVVTNAAGTNVSSRASLTVLMPPSITMQPASLTLNAGEQAEFKVLVEGTEPFWFQWLKNGQPLPSPGTNLLLLANVSPLDIADYSVVVTNLAGSATSQVAHLQVNVPPAITGGPTNLTVVQGDSGEFGVQVAGTEPLWYRWYKDDVALTGVGTNVLSLVNVKSSDAGFYWVVVTNVAGTNVSAKASLKVLMPPSITTQPANLTLNAGEQAEFKVVVEGTEPFWFQWLKNGEALTGADTNTLTLSSVGPLDIADYSVVVTNLAGSATSQVAHLQVNVPPSILSGPTNLTVVQGDSGEFAVQIVGTEPLSFRWYKDGVALPGVGTNVLSLVNLQPRDAGLYWVVVTNVAGTNQSSKTLLTVLSPPIITTQPTNLTLNAGEQAEFKVVVEGTEPFWFQWLKNGEALPGSDTSTLTLSSVGPLDIADYSVVVTNLAGNATSQVAHLQVNVPPAITGGPTNLTVVQGTSGEFAVQTAGTEPLSFRWYKDGVALPGVGTNVLSLVNLQPRDAGLYWVVVTNVAGTNQSPKALLTVLSPPIITTQPDSLTLNAGEQAEFKVVVEGTEPFWFQWLKNGEALPGSDTSTLTLSSVGPLDIADYSVVVTNLAGSATSQVAHLQVNVPPAITGGPTNLTVVQGTSGEFAVQTAGTEPLSFRWYKNGLALPGVGTNVLSLVNLQPRDAGLYWVAVTNVAGAIESSKALLTVLTPPFITDPPTNLVVNAGEKAEFSVTVEGSEPLSFQWLKDGQALPGEEMPSLLLSAATPLDVGDYSVVVTNAAGSATSQVARLWVNVGPSIVGGPTNLTVIQGADAEFSVRAEGTEPLVYQWFKDTNLLAAATNSVLRLTNAAPADEGLYWVLVTNVAGLSQSAQARLTVWVRPEILTQPQDVAVVEGGGAMFSVIATGYPDPAFQWLWNGTNIDGATNAAFVLDNARTNQAGTYAVRVFNPGGEQRSRDALLTVLVPPRITLQPLDLIVLQGGRATFFVDATGLPEPGYQWLWNGTNLAGATNQVLTLDNARTNQAGVYSVRVHNLAGEERSAGARLTVVVPPEIVLPPRDATAARGDAVTFSVAATGVPDPEYQWAWNGTNIAGATNSTLTLAAVQPAQSGVYTVEARNSAGKTGAQATLTVLDPPSIVVEPEDVDLGLGGTLRLVTEAEGSGPLSYQWYRNDASLPGATEPALSITNVQLTDRGIYRVVVTNLVGVAASRDAAVSVFEPPVLTTLPTNMTVVQGATVSLAGAASGSKPISFLWRKEGVDLAWATNRILTLTNVQAGDAGHYSVLASNLAGAVTSPPALLTVIVPPAIQADLQPLTVTNGARAVFTVTAAGTPPLVYTWFKDDLRFAQTASNALIFEAARPEDQGQYSVIVSNAAGTAASGHARLTVLSFGTLYGVATDALTKQPLAGVTVRVGDLVQTTGPDGAYAFTNVPPGSLTADFTAVPATGDAPLNVQFTSASVDGAHTLEAEKLGYSRYAYSPLELAPAERKEWSFSLSPSLEGLRLVLNWGQTPMDLDAHLLTPPIDGINYHVQYGSRFFGQTNRPPFAQLDSDATAGYGPETVTIASNVAGIYRYYVHNYQEDQGDTGSLPGSGAVVQIYSAAGLIQTVRVPAVGTGEYWDVCAIDGAIGGITVVNRIQDLPPAPDIVGGGSGGEGPSGGTDGASGTKYAWDFGDSGTSALADPVHRYTLPRTYSVTLVVTAPDGRQVSVTHADAIMVTGVMAPQLTIARLPAELVIRWETAESGFVLESRPSLTAGAWSAVTSLPVEDPAGSFTVRIPLAGEQYFRLRK